MVYYYCQVLYLIEILHQTTTLTIINNNKIMLYLIEILHQTTTIIIILLSGMLYLIEILHQTTTGMVWYGMVWCCILLKFYIKPQP